MDNMFTLGVMLSAKDMLSPVMGKAGQSASRLASKIQAVSGQMAVIGTASYASGRAMLSPVIQTIGAYKDLEKAQGEIASLGIGAKGIDAITKSAKEFSSQFAGTTANDFVSASYDIKSGISSLSDVTVGSFTKIAAMTGAATKSSTSEMTSLFASGYGIYREQFDKFGVSTIQGWNRLSDEEKDIKFGEYFSAGMSSSVQAFKTDGANMSAAISSLGAEATSAGISFAEQLSILGQLQATMSGSEAATKYRSFLTSAQGAGDKLDLQFTDANNQMLSMPKIIETIKDKYGETIDALESDELKKAFGTDEAVALVKLMYNETDTLTSNINTMNISLGEGTKKTREMALAMNKGKEFDLLKQKIGNVSSTIGVAFAPVVTKMTSVIGNVIDSIQTFTEENKTATTVIAYTVAGVGALLTVAGAIIIPMSAIGMALPALTVGFGMVSGAVGLLGTTMASVTSTFLMNPLGLAVAGIVAVGYGIYKAWGPISSFFTGLWDGVVSVFDSSISIIKTYFGWTPVGMLLNNWKPITLFFSALWDGVSNIFSNAWGTIKSSFNGVVDFIKRPFVSFFSWIESKFAWVVNIVGTVVDKVSNIGSSIGETVGGIGANIGDGLKVASNMFKFGDDSADENKSPSTFKTAIAGTAMAAQLVTAQPNPILTPQDQTQSVDKTVNNTVIEKVAAIQPNPVLTPQAQIQPIGETVNNTVVEKVAAIQPVQIFAPKTQTHDVDNKSITNAVHNNTNIENKSNSQKISSDSPIDIKISFGDIVVSSMDGVMDTESIQTQIDNAVRVALRKVEDSRRNRSFSDEDI